MEVTFIVTALVRDKALLLNGTPSPSPPCPGRYGPRPPPREYKAAWNTPLVCASGIQNTTSLTADRNLALRLINKSLHILATTPTSFWTTPVPKLPSTRLVAPFISNRARMRSADARRFRADEPNHRSSDNGGVNEVAVLPSFCAVQDGHGVGGTRPFSPAARTSTEGAKRNTNNNNRSGRSPMKVAVGH
jgi:hypothetical protein